ncbi:MAG TPA: hypothetical protein VF466_00845 [Candidatus Saccharimonadales bacterium]
MQTEQDIEPLLATQKEQLGLTFSDGDSVDGKSLAILGANIAIITYVNQTAAGLALWEYIVLYAPFVLSLALDVFSVWPQHYRGPGVRSELLQDYLNMPREDLLLQLLSDTQSAIEHNTHLNKLRLRACVYSIGLTGLGFLAVLLIL